MTHDAIEAQFWGGALSRWPEDVVADMRLTEADAEYLTHVGLPTDVDWNLEIAAPAPKAGLPVDAGLPVLARDTGIPICVVPEEDDKVVAVEPTGRRMVNSNVRAFGAFLMFYQDYRTRVRDLDEDDALALIDEIEATMISVDAQAMAEREGYWPAVVGQMRDGLL